MKCLIIGLLLAVPIFLAGERVHGQSRAYVQRDASCSHGKVEIRFDAATRILYVPRTGAHGRIWRHYDRYVFDKSVFKQR